jgi:hypothetical protein
MASAGKRIRILSKAELQDLYGLPVFDQNERLFYFQISPDEKITTKSFKSIESQIYFLLQLGYFKAKSMFFACPLSTDNQDVQHILKQYFSKTTLSLSPMGKRTCFNIQSRILQLFSWQRFDNNTKAKAIEMASKLVKICVDPRYIFEELLNFLSQNQVILPSYSTLQDIVGQALTVETKRLNQLVAKNLPPAVDQALQDMLQDEDQKMYGVTLLKRDAKGFNHTEIIKEIQKQQASIKLFKAAKQLIPKLEISEQNICYYAYLVDYYTVDRLKELSGHTTKLYLLCYVYYRFERTNDNLINGFIYHLNKYKDEAKAYGKDAVYDYKVEGQQYGKKAGQIFDLFMDEAVTDSELRPAAFKIVAKEKFPVLKAHVTQSFDEEEFRWDYYKTAAKMISANLRPIIKVLEFYSDEVNHPLIQALTFLQSTWHNKKSLKQIKTDKFPTKCITKAYDDHVYDTVAAEGKSQKVLNVEAYEFMVYDQLAKALDADEIFVKDSFSFKSLKQDLLPDWDDNKDDVLAKLNNPVLNTPIEEQLQSFEHELDTLIVEVNQNITQDKNKEFKIKSSKDDPNLKTWTLSYAKKKDEINNPFYDQLPKVTLSKVLRFVDNQCCFTKAFTHIKPRFAKTTEFDIEAIFAILTANATNYGIYQMAGICDIGYEKLFATLKSLFRLETLKNANDILRQSIAELPIFKDWDLLEQIRVAALDGKKIQTRFKHILARYSTKYFGQKQGVVSHSLNYNNMCANTKIHSANEHESHHSYGLVYNSIIDADWYCGDTHSINQAQFVLFHLISRKFTPHLKKIRDKASEIVSFKDPKIYEKYLIKPSKKLDQKLIKEDWNNLQHILASMLMGHINHNVVVKKLSSHKRKTKTQQALWEYNKILQSMHILKFIDDPLYRQAIRGALSRIEGYHQLIGKIGGVHGGKFRGTTENELMVWNECCSLIANVIIYYNTLILSQIYQAQEKQGNTQVLEFIKRLSPIAWCHIILDGYYQFRNIAGIIDLEQMIANLVFEDKHSKKSKT